MVTKCLVCVSVVFVFCSLKDVCLNDMLMFAVHMTEGVCTM